MQDGIDESCWRSINAPGRTPILLSVISRKQVIEDITRVAEKTRGKGRPIVWKGRCNRLSFLGSLQPRI